MKLPKFQTFEAPGSETGGCLHGLLGGDGNGNSSGEKDLLQVCKYQNIIKSPQMS